MPHSEIKLEFCNYAALLSLELCPACPNSIIEAQMAGIPILCYNTGSIEELVHPYLNPILDYGANPHLHHLPRVDQLNEIAFYLLKNFNRQKEIFEYTKDFFSFENVGKKYYDILGQFYDIKKM